MRKQKYYYKVVHKEYGTAIKTRCLSYFVNLIDELSTEYKINKWVEPKLKGTKLFVFDTLKHAREWSGSIQIYKCEIKNPGRRLFILCGMINVLEITENVENFWKNKKRSKYSPPKGTIVCDAVKLIEEVQ